MRFLHDRVPEQDLTYSDVFLVPNRSIVSSRLDVDLATSDGSGTTIPIVAANMTAVAGRRMAETIARRGGLAVIPQDIPHRRGRRGDRLGQGPAHRATTPRSRWRRPALSARRSTCCPSARTARWSWSTDGRPVGVVTEADCAGVDRFTQLPQVMSRELLTLPDGIDAEDAFNRLTTAGTGSRRWSTPTAGSSGSSPATARCGPTLYNPAVDAAGRLRVAAAIGINGDVAGQGRRRSSPPAWTSSSIDTAHGHQERMLEALRAVRALDPPVPVVAGNVVTAEGVTRPGRGRRRHRQGRRRARAPCAPPG